MQVYPTSFPFSDADNLYNEIDIFKSKICPTTSTKTLGVLLDDKLRMEEMIADKCRSSYYHLRNLGRIKHALSHDLRIMLVNNLVHSKLDYF